MRNLRLAVSRVLVFACIAAIGPLSVVSVRSQDASAPRVATVERVMQALRERMGTDPSECGRYEKPVIDELAVATSVQCVIDAATRGQQSWTIVYGPGADWRVAHGAFSGRDGRVREFFYDSMEPVGDGRATLEVKSCPSPKFVIKDQGRAKETPTCGNCGLRDRPSRHSPASPTLRSDNDPMRVGRRP